MTRVVLALAVAGGVAASAATGHARDMVTARQAQTLADGEATESLQTGNITMRYWPGQERLAARIADLITRARLPALPGDILEQPPPITVYLPPDETRFAELTGGRAPHWGAGVALPARGVIVIPVHRGATGGRDALGRLLAHELAHVALHRYLEPARIPRWFTEGYATWSAGQLDFEAAWLLRIAFLTRRAPSLDSLVLDWPSGVRDARVAYLLSASVLEYLYENGGEFALQRFFERWRAGGSLEDALVLTYGLRLAQLERHWSRSVRRRYGWLAFFSQALVIWALLAIIVFALYLVRRRRDRRKLDRMRTDELPDEPAWWDPEAEPDARAETDPQDRDGRP